MTSAAASESVGETWGSGWPSLAARADMSPDYLAALERDPTLHVSASALIRLAASMDVTVEQLMGAGRLSPTGAGGPIGRPALTAMGPEECAALLTVGGVGRFVFDGPEGPDGGAGQLPGRRRGRGVPDRGGCPCWPDPIPGPVAFEVDQIDDDLREGWSVLATGRSEIASEPGELDRLRELPVEPWAAGDKGVYVRVHPEHLTGRRIRSRPDRG